MKPRLIKRQTETAVPQRAHQTTANQTVLNAPPPASNKGTRRQPAATPDKAANARALFAALFAPQLDCAN